MPSAETDKQRVLVELVDGTTIVGDTLQVDAFGVQVLRQGQPYGNRIPFHWVQSRRYFKAKR